MDAEILEWQAFEKTHPIVVGRKLTKPHPITWETGKRIGFDFDEAACPLSTDIRWFHIDVSPQRAEHALCIADALIKACERRGFEIRIDPRDAADGRIILIIDGEPVSLGLFERGHPARRLSLETSFRRWSDCLSRPLAKQLNSVILTHRKMIAASLQHRRAEEARERRIAKLHRDRDSLRAEIKAEREAVEELVTNAENWERAQLIRAFVAAIEAQPIRSGGRKKRKAWAKWAYAQADRMDPLCDPPSSVLDTPRWRYRELRWNELLNEDGSIEAV